VEDGRAEITYTPPQEIVEIIGAAEVDTSTTDSGALVQGSMINVI